MRRNIRYVTLLIIIIHSFVSTTAQNATKALIYGKLNNSSGKKIVLQDKPLGAMGKNYKVNEISSYIPTNDDSICFTVFINFPTSLSLGIDGKNGWFPFIISPGDSVLINGNGDSVSNWTIKGSYQNSIFKKICSHNNKAHYKKIYRKINFRRFTEVLYE